MPGASDGAHCERERLPLTNAVSGLPLRTCEITEACQPRASHPAAPRMPFAKGSCHVTLPTQLCLS